MSETAEMDDLDILEDLRNNLYDAISNTESEKKVGVLLKVIELKRKLSVEGKGEKKFWEMVNKIRQEELTKAGSSANSDKEPGTK